MEDKKVKIKCPECNSVEDAEIQEGWPWSIYIHKCTSCGYIIMESDWQEIEPEKIN